MRRRDCPLDLEKERDFLSMLVLGAVLEMDGWEKHGRHIFEDVGFAGASKVQTIHMCDGYKTESNGFTIGVYGSTRAVYLEKTKPDDYFVTISDDLGDDLKIYRGLLAEFVYNKLHFRLDDDFVPETEEVQAEVDALQKIIEKI